MNKECPNCKSKNVSLVKTQFSDNLFGILGIDNDSKKIMQNELLPVNAYCCNDCLHVFFFGIKSKENDNQ